MEIAAVLGRFSHGLVFFSLGLTARFLHYRSHRIRLAQHLGWLTAFAIGEALIAWHALFNQLLPDLVPLPPLVQALEIGTTYTSLLMFGIQTFLTEETYKARLPLLLLSVCSLWLVPYGAAAVATGFDWQALASPTEIGIRYALALSGGLLTAVGFRQQSYRSLTPALRTRIRPALRLIELSTGAFGLLNLGVVPPLATLGARTLSLDLGHPISLGWAWTLVGAGMVWGLARSLTTIQNEIEQWVEDVERLQALAEDRERIGRELHDGIIQSIYAAGLLLESIQPMVPLEPDRAQAQIGRVIDRLNGTIQDIRRYIFDLRSDMQDYDLPEGIEHLLRDFRVNTLLETEFRLTGTVVPIQSTNRRRHIFQIVREALANTARHAQARKVQVHLDYDIDGIVLTISDDGIGMKTLQVGKGYGLRNIRERTRLLEGTLRIESAPGAGVTYHLTIPYT